MIKRAEIFFSGIILSISLNLAWISVHKSLETIKSSSIIKSFTSDNLFLKKSLDLEFKPSSFVPGLIPRPKQMVVSPIFTTDIPAGPSKKRSQFLWDFTTLMQSIQYRIICYFGQMRFTCPSSAWKKYLHWLSITPIIFYIIFIPFMNHIEDFLLFWIKRIYTSRSFFIWKYFQY